MPRRSFTCFRWAVACSLIACGWARDLKFKIDEANSCDDMLVQLSAGDYDYPLILTVTPFEHKPLNITVDRDPSAPTAARNITVPQLPWEVGRQIVVSLSDQTGFASCGTSDTFVLGPSQTGNKCNVTLPTLDFFFSLDSDLVQCQSYPVTRFTKATQPVKIFFQIPLGDSFAIQAPVSSVFTYTWLANVKAGTPVVFTMVDAVGKQGGSSGARVVGASNNSACLHSGSRLSRGAIAGIVVSIITLIFGALCTTLYLRKRKRTNNYQSVDHQSDLRISIDAPSPRYQTTPFIPPTEPESTSVSMRNSTHTHTRPPSAATHSLLASSHPTTPGRVIVHRDITEGEGGDEGQVVELPPEYSARRAPIPGITPPRPDRPLQRARRASPAVAEKRRGRRRPQ